MKHSAKVMSLAVALVMTSEMVPQASAQTPPPAPPAQQQTQGQQTQAQQKQSNQQQYNHPKARGAAGGAIIGGAMGNEGAGAVIGAGHSRRQERRNNR
jgi:hypothetical protein